MLFHCNTPGTRNRHSVSGLHLAIALHRASSTTLLESVNAEQLAVQPVAAGLLCLQYWVMYAASHTDILLQLSQLLAPGADGFCTGHYAIQAKCITDMVCSLVG
jgi:hypothetical protein